MISSETRPLHVGIAMALAAACTTAAVELTPRLGFWIPSSILVAIPLSSTRLTRINAALDSALNSASSIKSELESLFGKLAEAQGIDDFNRLALGSEDFTASLTELLGTARSIQARGGVSAEKVERLVRLLASARSLSAGIDNMRRQFVAPTRTYVSKIDPAGMAALSRHGWSLSTGAI